MEELKQILRAHAERYPAMEPADAVKLIYQNEFGGGHLIRSREAAGNYLRLEYNTVEQASDTLLCEDIGNGIIRVNLGALEPENLDDLLGAFVASAQVHTGDLVRFRGKLNVLRELAKEGMFAFGSEALEQYLEAYEKAGFPAVSHSERYRESYHPAYRIICRDLMFSL